MEIKLTLTPEEINGILAVLGDLPSKTGAWVLITKIQDQLKEQSKSETDSN